jgi:DNA replication protein DnaC
MTTKDLNLSLDPVLLQTKLTPQAKNAANHSSADYRGPNSSKGHAYTGVKTSSPWLATLTVAAANIIFLGGVGLGKSHLATAIGYEACLNGYSVLFAPAVDVINTLAAAQKEGRLKLELNKYIKPNLLILDELGYLPIDKRGADLLFQVISQRYERGALIITSNRAYKDWPEIFNQDGTLTSAILDRLLHHAETVVIDGKSYRMKDKIEA